VAGVTTAVVVFTATEIRTVILWQGSRLPSSPSLPQSWERSRTGDLRSFGVTHHLDDEAGMTRTGVSQRRKAASALAEL
jgi:hypothetical protein